MEHLVRLPGFTADSSLGGGAHYATLPRRGLVMGQGNHASAVIPQLFVWGTGDCIPGCVCVKEEGCPCCGYGDNPLFPGFLRPRRPFTLPSLG
jgi:hypothetical protein